MARKLYNIYTFSINTTNAISKDQCFTIMSLIHLKVSGCRLLQRNVVSHKLIIAYNFKTANPGTKPQVLKPFNGHPKNFFKRLTWRVWRWPCFDYTIHQGSLFFVISIRLLMKIINVQPVKKWFTWKIVLMFRQLKATYSSTYSFSHVFAVGVSPCWGRYRPLVDFRDRPCRKFNIKSKIGEKWSGTSVSGCPPSPPLPTPPPLTKSAWWREVNVCTKKCKVLTGIGSRLR